MAIGERQIKTTMKYDYLPVRVAKTEKQWHHQMLVKTTPQCWWSENFTPLRKIVCQFFLKKDQHVPTINPAMVLLGIYSREIKTYLHTN